MKNTNEHIIRKYIKKVLKYVPNTYRSRLKNELNNSLFDSFHDIPNLTNSILYEHFGSPEHFATEYMSVIDNDKLHAHMIRTKRNKRILIIVLVLLIISLIPISIWILNENDRHVGHYYTDDINYLNTY